MSRLDLRIRSARVVDGTGAGYAQLDRSGTVLNAHASITI